MLFACGANQLNQLGVHAAGDAEQRRENITRFKHVILDQASSPSAQSKAPVWTGWTQNGVILDDERLAIIGHDAQVFRIDTSGLTTDLPRQNTDSTSSASVTVLGDHNGIQAALHRSGVLFFPSAECESQPTLRPRSSPGPLLAQVAYTAAGLTAAIPLQAPAATVQHVLTWPSFGDVSKPDSVPGSFLAWHMNPSASANAPATHTALPGAPVQLVANAVSIALLTSKGVVYTLGDARFGWCLGRVPSAESPAEKPCFAVPEIPDAHIEKLTAARGGWAMGAISQEGDAWIWGMPGPGRGVGGATDGWLEYAGCGSLDGMFRVEVPCEPGEPVYCACEEYPTRLMALALGADHAVALNGAGAVYTIGRDSHGQLGLGNDAGPDSVAKELLTQALEAQDEGEAARRDVLQREVSAALGRGETVMEWTRVDDSAWGGRRVVDVGAGDMASFVVVE